MVNNTDNILNAINANIINAKTCFLIIFNANKIITIPNINNAIKLEYTYILEATSK